MGSDDNDTKNILENCHHGAAVKKMNIVACALSNCGGPSQTVEHRTTLCPRPRPPNGYHGLMDVDNGALAWLHRAAGLKITAKKKKLHYFHLRYIP